MRPDGGHCQPASKARARPGSNVPFSGPGAARRADDRPLPIGQGGSLLADAGERALRLYAACLDAGQSQRVATSSRASEAAPGGASPSGHRQLPHTADRVLEAWGPDRATCLSEALLALVESFAEVPDRAAVQVLPLGASAGGAKDVLVSLLEEVIYAVDALGVVPLRFHLAEAEDGSLAGDMEVVRTSEVELVGSVPKGVSYHALEIASSDGGWRCRVLVDV